MTRRLEAASVSAVDALLEASVVGSFCRFGYLLRRRMFAWEEVAPGSGVGRVAVVTGASSGIGFAVAAELMDLGWRVVVVSRDRERNADALSRLRMRSGGAVPGGGPSAVEGHVADLADLGEVRRLASELSSVGNVHALIHGAGVLNRSFHRTDQGYEATFALGVLGPTLLTTLLLEQLRAAARDTGSARVVTISSGGMYPSRLDIDRLVHVRPSSFRPLVACSLTKRAQVELCLEWARRLELSAVVPVTMHPGWVATPALLGGLPGFARLARPILRTPDQGADTVVWLAGELASRLTPGSFYLDRRERAVYVLPRTRTDAVDRSAALDDVARLVDAPIPAPRSAP